MIKTKTFAMLCLFAMVLAIGTVEAKSLYEQADNEGGCGGHPILVCPEGQHRCGTGCCLDEQPATNEEPTQTGHSGSGGPVSTKRHWVVTAIVDCNEYAVYETYQVGVCDDGESRCNVKTYYNRWKVTDICLFPGWWL